jgi:hypothetical protein
MKLKIANGGIGEAQRDPWVGWLWIFTKGTFCHEKFLKCNRKNQKKVGIFEVPTIPYIYIYTQATKTDHFYPKL